jgi:hypothetical protein
MENLAEGIAWNAQSYGVPSRRTTQRYVAPSWSWASAHAAITFLKMDPRHWDFVLGIEKIAVEPISSDTAGLLRSAALRANGRFCLFSPQQAGLQASEGRPFSV